MTVSPVEMLVGVVVVCGSVGALLLLLLFQVVSESEGLFVRCLRLPEGVCDRLRL